MKTDDWPHDPPESLSNKPTGVRFRLDQEERLQRFVGLPENAGIKQSAVIRRALDLFFMEEDEGRE